MNLSLGLVKTRNQKPALRGQAQEYFCYTGYSGDNQIPREGLQAHQMHLSPCLKAVPKSVFDILKGQKLQIQKLYFCSS